MQKMATTVSNTLRDIGNSAAGAVEGAVHNKKIADLEKNKKNQQDTKQNTTTDWGAKVSDLDHALKIVDEKGNHVGPTLLEDEVFRERVSYHCASTRARILILTRSIDLITSVFPSVLSTQEELVLTVLSSSSKAARMSPRLAS
jgi:hypothetical protein